MITNVWVEPYTLMMGVHMMDVMIEVLSVSGLAYAPFVVALITSMVKAMSQGEDEGSAGELAIKFLREKIIIMVPVFVLAFVPTRNTNVSYESSIVTFTCDADATSQSSDVSTQSSSLVGNFNGSESRVPLFWALVHDYASQMTNVAIASMPCASDINLAKTVLAATNLSNPADQQLVGDWSNQCLSPAMRKYVSNNTEVDNELWAGSGEMRAIYADGSMNMKVKTDMADTAGLSYDATSVVGAEATINCDQVYAHIQRAAVNSAHQNPSALETVSQFFRSDEDEARVAVEQVAKISPGNQQQSNLESQVDTLKANGDDFSLSWTDLTGTLKKLVGLIGVAIGNIFKAPDSVIMRNSIPISVCVYQMLFLAVAPILLVFSGFNLKTCLSLAALYFGLEYTNAIIAMGVWFDNVLTAIFFKTSAGGLAAAVSDSGAKENITIFQSAVLGNVQYSSYTLLPNIWMMILAYVGAKGGASMMGSASTPLDQNATQNVTTKINAAVKKALSQVAFEAGERAGAAATKQAPSSTTGSEDKQGGWG